MSAGLWTEHLVTWQVPGLPWPSWETCTCAVGVDHERGVGA